MALVGNMLAIQGGPSVINYDMFVAVFCMLALFYLTLVSVKESFVIHPIFPLVLDALCTLFTLIAGIATAAYLHVRSCSNRVSPLVSKFHHYNALTSYAELRSLQHCHSWQRHSMSRGPGRHRLLLVRVRNLPRLHRHERHGISRRRQHPPRWHPSWPGYEPGLRAWPTTRNDACHTSTALAKPTTARCDEHRIRMLCPNVMTMGCSFRICPTRLWVFVFLLMYNDITARSANIPAGMGVALALLV